MFISIRDRILVVISLIILIFGGLLFYYFPKIFSQALRTAMMESYSNEVSGVAETVAMGVNVALYNHSFEGVETSMNFAKKDNRLVYVALVKYDTLIAGKRIDIKKEIFLKYPEDAYVDLDLKSSDSLVVNSAKLDNKIMAGELIVVFSTKEIQQKVISVINDLHKTFYKISIFVILIALLLGLLLASMISRPILKLKEAVLQVAEGNYRTPIIENANNEIGELSVAFNSMSHKLDKQRTDLFAYADEMKLLKIKAEEKNNELARKNIELEQFAYVASHDLQEPLRTTISFVQLLKEQYFGKLDANADKYITYIVQSSNRMGILIKDLLDFSRIGKNQDMEEVDCNMALQDVIADIDKVIKDSNAEITAEYLPVISGYNTELKQLFQNLLLNGIKFRKKSISPKINITVQKKDDYWLFGFIDNGIGIEQEHNERIFIIFQRLHTRGEYQGSGIGLSNCKKIVELHHGKIWVESIQGEGSTFYFTIHSPKEKINKAKSTDNVMYPPII
jgi:signal transduction histidine kinase